MWESQRLLEFCSLHIPGALGLSASCTVRDPTVLGHIPLNAYPPRPSLNILCWQSIHITKIQSNQISANQWHWDPNVCRLLHWSFHETESIPTRLSWTFSATFQIYPGISCHFSSWSHKREKTFFPGPLEGWGLSTLPELGGPIQYSSQGPTFISPPGPADPQERPPKTPKIFQLPIQKRLTFLMYCTVLG